MSSKKFFLPTVLAAVMMGLSLFSTDIYLTIQHHIAADFAVKEGLIHYTFFTFFLGLTLSYTLSYLTGNHLSTAKLAKLGFVLYLAGTATCIFSQSFSLFLVGRFFQGVSAAILSISIRDFIGHQFNMKEIAKIYSIAFPVLGFSPAIFPLLGNTITNHLSWRYAFALLFIMGIFALLLFNQLQKHAKQHHASSQTTDTPATFSIFKAGLFWQLSLIYALVFCVYYTYLINAPLIFKAKHLPYSYLTSSFLGMSIFYFLANLGVRKLLNKYPITKLMYFGCTFFFIISGIMLLCAFDNRLLPFSLIIPICLLCATNAFILPLASAKILAHFPLNRIKVLSLISIIQFAAIGLMTLLSSHFVHENPVHMCLFIMVLSAFILILINTKTSAILTEQQ